VTLDVLHTPGHTPGSVSIYCEDLGVVFSGDALSADGPRPHDGEFPDFAAQLSAIGAELLPLPVTTRVLSGHGEESTVAEAEQRFDSWFAARPEISGDADD
jgi:glyoxylase-like metal-dependent hydrolase (beta-lactamase superfamily II)